jgi:hypothetical protein
VDIRGDDEAVWVGGILHGPNMPQPFLIGNVALLGQRAAAVMPNLQGWQKGRPFFYNSPV